MANAHRRRNTMTKVKINEVSFTEEVDIREGITQAFQSHLLEPPAMECSVAFLQGKRGCLFVWLQSVREKWGGLGDFPLLFTDDTLVFLGALPTTYLGLPLGAAHNSMVAWDEVEERFRKRLAMWKRNIFPKEEG
ncbi:hypothetical protein CK203_052943 [Vitis vinifera]|uniref:Uncharacterized protein n=1 Tax=Vitis vinifera TaxID=29760 RepID=A0A438GT38_VITVI|nr:hypothetical protein CK203_052943 [Vitis vinifera]